MAEFPTNYFQAEVRDGFSIEAMMKCAWGAYIEVLEVFDDLCSRHGLQYYAAYGTLLGAVRHKGFIPWDDDIDLFMFRDDYERLLHMPSSELPAGFLLHSIYENNIHPQPFAIFVNSSKIDYSPGFLHRFHGCPYIVGLDLFPLDHMSDEESQTMEQVDRLEIVMEVLQLYYNSPDAAEELIPDLETLCNVRLKRGPNLKNQLLRLTQDISRLYNETPGRYITNFITHIKSGLRMRQEWFDNTQYMPFETTQIPVPAGWHEILTAIYGDYCTPVYNSAAHDYPFYKKQERILAEAILRTRHN